MRTASTGLMVAAAPLPKARTAHRADAERHADAGRLADGGQPSAEAASRSRRRVGWRKGTDIDQEFWPIEAFGGVSDEQFWDDLAADKPGGTTGRTAQADSGPSRQLAEAYPPPRPGAADRTLVQVAVPSVQAARAPSPIATQPYPTPIQPSPAATQPYPTPIQPSPAATQPVRAAHQPAESRGRRNAGADGPGADEDPLTSPAYSLRPQGAVGGRSYRSNPLRPDPLRTDPLRTDPLGSDGYRADPLRADGYRQGSASTGGTTAYQPRTGSAGRHAATTAYPYPWQPRTQPTQLMNAPLYGEIYGYRNPVGPAGDPRRANGNWRHSRPGGNGASDGTWGSGHAYPPVNGYRGPYDPRGSDRR